MAKQLINLGTVVNDGTGDALRVGAEKINENFTELYNFLSDSLGQMSLVSSIVAGDGLQVNSKTGNVEVSAKIASPTELGSIKLGTGLSITESGVLSVTGISGSYNDLTDTPDLSLYQLVANAFSGDYSDLNGVPQIPASLYDLGITPGDPGQALLAGPAGTASFGTLYDQGLSTTDDVAFNSITSNTTLTFNADTNPTQSALQGYTAQYDFLQNVELPALQQQYNTTQATLNYWYGLLSSAPPGSPQQQQAQGMVGSYSSQLGSISAQLNGVQGQIGVVSSQISYLNSILSVTNATVGFNHLTQSVVFSSAVTVDAVNLPDSNSIYVSTGTTVSSADKITLLASGKPWVFNTSGNIELPLNGDILDSNGVSVLGIPVVLDGGNASSTF